ncbi:MAG: hypothetical protein PWQ28_696 [Candidatus Woesearchaeota archaeon]|nr:hypothetical protein [Candidatus Woesearchaeota archaeon]
MGLMIERIKSGNSKRLIKQIGAQFGCDEKTFLESFREFALLRNKDKIYLVRKEAVLFIEEGLRINNIGLYFCKEEEEGIRLSVEGSYFVEPCAGKNILELSKDSAIEWMQGKDIQGDFSGYDIYVIIKYKTLVLGCGKITKDKKVLKNFLPKERITYSDLPFP